MIVTIEYYLTFIERMKLNYYKKEKKGKVIGSC